MMRLLQAPAADSAYEQAVTEAVAAAAPIAGGQPKIDQSASSTHHNEMMDLLIIE